MVIYIYILWCQFLLYCNKKILSTICILTFLYRSLDKQATFWNVWNKKKPKKNKQTKNKTKQKKFRFVLFESHVIQRYPRQLRILQKLR
jgi:SOS response regulatory protein OraA/RecX